VTPVMPLSRTETVTAALDAAIAASRPPGPSRVQQVEVSVQVAVKEASEAAARVEVAMAEAIRAAEAMEAGVERDTALASVIRSAAALRLNYSQYERLEEELADAIEFQVKDWAMKNPAECDAILALAPSRDDVIESTRFFFTSFRLHASDVEDNGGLEQDLTGLAGQALYEFSVALRDASVHKIVGTDFTKGVFEVLSRLARKAESLAFLGPSIAEVASVLTSTVAMLPADGTLNAAHAVMVRSIIDQMLEPRKLAASGFLSLRANMNAAAVNAVAPTQAPVREAVEPSRAAAFAW
jgi:hypothetical protein